jgi:hypothetical protein
LVAAPRLPAGRATAAPTARHRRAVAAPSPRYCRATAAQSPGFRRGDLAPKLSTWQRDRDVTGVLIEIEISPSEAPL